MAATIKLGDYLSRSHSYARIISAIKVVGILSDGRVNVSYRGGTIRTYTEEYLFEILGYRRISLHLERLQGRIPSKDYHELLEA